MAIEHPQLRVSHADRDEAVARLTDAYTEGRLDQREFDDRLECALAARAAGDLTSLLADLPSAGPARPSRRAGDSLGRVLGAIADGLCCGGTRTRADRSPNPVP